MLNFLSNGVSGLTVSGLGLICGVLFLFFPFAWGGVGGGDVKLLGAIGSLLGPYMILKIFLASAVFGGILSLAAIMKSGATKESLASIKNKMLLVYLTKDVKSATSGGNRKQIKIPYACAIDCGTLFVLFVLKGG